MSTKEERDEAIGDAMVEKIRAETLKFVAEAKKFDAETDLAEVKTDQARLDRDEWFPVVIQRFNGETQKFSAESRFLDARAGESHEAAENHRAIRTGRLVYRQTGSGSNDTSTSG